MESIRKRRILLLTGDVARWAITVRALELQKHIPEIDFTIRGDEEHITADFAEYDLIHILYSGGITKFYELVMKEPNKFILSLVSFRTLTGMYDNLKKLKEMYQKCRSIVALNPRLQELAVELCGDREKVHYIPNGVDGELFNQDFTVGFVGANEESHNEYKGKHLIEEACGRLGVKFLTQSNEYPSRIVPHEEMPEFYKKIDCLCIASIGEGTNNPMMEALSMNVPVISTDTGIARELGVILVERTVESIAKGIEQVYTHNKMKPYLWKNIARQYAKLY